MKFDDKHTFDKPAATVMKMFSDRAYFERKYQELGFWDVAILDHDKSDRRFRIKARYTTRNDSPLPDFAKKILGESTVITQQDTWDIEKKTGRLEIEIKGAPVKVTADMVLKDEGKGAANTLKWIVSCGIPLLGGKLEKLVADDIQSKSKADVAASRKILASY
jgi:hypothetical protein